MDLYQEIILDHFRHPRNQGKLSASGRVLKCTEANVGCGDEFSVSLQLDEVSEKILDIKWVGQGCAISTASMSLLSEYVIGKSVEEVKALDKQLLLELLNLEEINPGREKCMLLGLNAVKRSLEMKNNETASK
jgi:nitrogen fixation NifU-like protein